MQDSLYVSSGGAELLDEIGPLWEELNKHHVAKAPHFADVFARKTFLGFKQATLEKAVELYVVLVLDGQGMAVAYCLSTIDDRGVGHLDSLFVSPLYRGQGLGESLAKQSIKWMRMQGVERISLAVAAGNEEVLAFYERLGFFPAKIVLEHH